MMRSLISAEWSRLLIEEGRASRFEKGKPRKTILILGGGMAGYSVARGLEKALVSDDMEIVLIDMRGKMVYQPFLAEVVSGAVEPRHIQVSLQKHLPEIKTIQARVTQISTKERKVVVENATGRSWEIDYDFLVVALGGVTKIPPIPGIAETAVGLKTTEEAAYIRNRIVSNFTEADDLPLGDPERQRLLTVMVVGGGLSGIECLAEALSLIRDLVAVMRTITMKEIGLHLIEATGRIMPEIPSGKSAWVIEQVEKRGASVHLNTFVTSASDGVVKTSDGCEYHVGLLVWTAGQTANPVLRNSDLPLDSTGRLRCNAKLQVETGDGRASDAVFGCGDAVRVEDLSGCGLPDGSCDPTAQHAVRQASVIVKNLVATFNGAELKEYVHKNAGCVIGLGRGLGIFASGDKRIVLKGWIAWAMHRAYHSLALPTLERKLRVWNDWLLAFFCGRDVVSTIESLSPRAFFEEHACMQEEKGDESGMSSD